MNIYSLLRRLIIAARLGDTERKMWLDLVGQLEARNAFGTTAVSLTATNERKRK